MALYFLDDFDAKMNSMQSLIKSEAGTGDWTDYQRALERYIYKGSYVSDESPGEEKKTESGQGEKRASGFSSKTRQIKKKR